MIDISKNYRTRDGRETELFDNGIRIFGFIGCSNKASTWNKQGHHEHNPELDLIEVTEMDAEQMYQEREQDIRDGHTENYAFDGPSFGC